MSDVGQTEGHTDRLMTIKRGFIIKVQYNCDYKNERNKFLFGIYKKHCIYRFGASWIPSRPLSGLVRDVRFH